MYKLILKISFGLVLLLSISACVTKSQLRTADHKVSCHNNQDACSNSYIERYPEHDLAFIEFTERGNLYNRAHSRQVLKFINEQSKKEDGVAVFVFVHGWQHTASHKDSNVTQFREYLSRAAENEVVGKRKVIGLFLGWQGKTNSFPGLKHLTYWSRKAVAEEVGAGGATEIFARLHQILISQYADQPSDGPLYKNTFVIIGHSFGGAIILSALHDVLLNDLIEADTNLDDGPHPCDNVNRYADGIILLNPAIEANKVILLKEAASRCLFDRSQPKLMHVLSSDGDKATQFFFPLGQRVNITSPIGPKKLDRTIMGKKVLLDERALGLTTIGNIGQLRTSYLSFNDEAQEFMFDSCRDGLDKCQVKRTKQQENYFETDENDPLSFIKTDKNFIKNHNDVFGCYTQSYITAVIFETQATDKGYRDDKNKSVFAKQPIQGCDHRDFDFRRCFNRQLDDYECDLPE